MHTARKSAVVPRGRRCRLWELCHCGTGARRTAPCPDPCRLQQSGSLTQTEAFAAQSPFSISTLAAHIRKGYWRTLPCAGGADSVTPEYGLCRKTGECAGAVARRMQRCTGGYPQIWRRLAPRSGQKRRQSESPASVSLLHVSACTIFR